MVNAFLCRDLGSRVFSPMENVFLTYSNSVFSDQRKTPATLGGGMSKRSGKDRPRAAIIPVLLGETPSRSRTVFATSKGKAGSESEYLIAEPPETRDWEDLREAARGCRACPLWREATQTVFGEGSHPAKMMLLGEQPGDAEDRNGRPFVGPAGKLLDKALEEAGVNRSSVYLTNVVKHFKWKPRGKRRIHQKPNGRDIASCRPWMEAELRLVQPRVLVCLGATAASAIFGPAVRILRDRGQVRASLFVPQTLITFHPSVFLRATDETSRDEQYRQFIDDLCLAKRCLS
jgi:uracil-DNA glycosylase family protein